MVGEDLSQEHAWQFSQEVRLASSFSGPFNFSAGTNYMHYETVEDYYVLFNLISATEQALNGGGPWARRLYNLPRAGVVRVSPFSRCRFNMRSIIS